MRRFPSSLNKGINLEKTKKRLSMQGSSGTIGIKPENVTTLIYDMQREPGRTRIQYRRVSVSIYRPYRPNSHTSALILLLSHEVRVALKLF